MCQETVVPLRGLPWIQNSGPEIQGRRTRQDTAVLPFFDDFSQPSYLLNDTNWMDNQCYVSQTFGVKPPSIGVAVFDGLRNDGKAYEPDDVNSKFESADTLTSLRIDLSPYQASDSLYISFFYQPQGRGDAPEPSDSMTLQFLADSLLTDTGWVHDGWFTIWSIQGSELRKFRQFILPVHNSQRKIFTHDHFQFRFVGYSNRSGNLDNHIIDYVYLDRGRNGADTSFNDIAAYFRPRSLLQRYWAMPSKQFRNNFATEIRDSVQIPIKTNTRLLRNISYGYAVKDLNTGLLIGKNPSVQADNIGDYQSKIFTQKLSLTVPPNLPDSFAWQLKAGGITSPDEFPFNDSASSRMVFSNFYAYDDGTAEAGYGLINTTQGAAALRFNLNVPDTLQGVSIHFNQGEQAVQNQAFKLTIWKSLTAVGEISDADEILYQKTIPSAEYSNYVNAFVYFPLDTELILDGEFYVGWTQDRSFILNVGFDQNYDEFLNSGFNPNLFYNSGGKWRESRERGVPMIRPYFGPEPLSNVGVAEPGNTSATPQMYPNPSQGWVNFSSPDAILEILVFDIQGRLLMRIENEDTIDLSAMRRGVYYCQVRTNHGGSMHKLILN